MKKENKQKINKSYLKLKQGFTLIELLIVIAIIGILAGVVMVNAGSSIERSRRASAISTMASVLPELVTCQDDGGAINKPNSTTDGGGLICNATGHTATWPSIANTGYSNGAIHADNIDIADYTFTATKADQPTITCTYSTGVCED